MEKCMVLNNQNIRINENPLFIIAVFFAFFLAVTIASIIKKIHYRFILKKRYFVIPRPGIKGITNIAMVVALSVAVLIILTLITSNFLSVMFRAFPGTRVTIESIFIKIGGLLFGPFLGLFVGLLTDLLAVLMTAGVFHYGYFLSALAIGLLSGLVRTFATFNSQSKTKFCIYSTVLFSLLIVATFFFVNSSLESKLELEFGFKLVIEKSVVIVILTSFIVIAMITVWIFYLYSIKKDRKNKIDIKKRYFAISDKDEKLNFMLNQQQEKQKNKKNKFNSYCATLTCVITTELFIGVFSMPIFDTDVTTMTYEQWLSIRIALFIPMVLLNMIIIYPVYTIVIPLITYNYETELIESLDKKLIEN